MKRGLPGLEISAPLLERMLGHARAAYPLESCGILAGEKGKIARVYCLENMEKSPTAYFMAPEEQLRVLREIEEDGLELSAIYHSHPHSSAYPSSRDVALAFFPDALMLIISLKDREFPDVKAFQIKEGKITRREVRILPPETN